MNITIFLYLFIICIHFNNSFKCSLYNTENVHCSHVPIILIKNIDCCISLNRFKCINYFNFLGIEKYYFKELYKTAVTGIH